MAMENPLVGELFPIGMHVLAVDDNRVCLNMLEKMLLKCNYKVTTTTESVKALEILRENKDRFDLVICDVNMPEMDGFKLLKKVGLEMDLPFIMLSGNGDTKSVMKGVMNGASDYILKPIRMEEVKTIWQHVVRKKIDGKDRDNNVDEKIDNVVRVCSQDTASDENDADKNQIVGEKRKNRSDSEEDNDTDGSIEKKPRFVWDTELHKKFVVAVNQLGLDKAYPKKILELMNVEGLTRENVASHLQKFRLNLKRSDKYLINDATLDSTSPYGRRFESSAFALPSYASPSYGSSHLVCRLNSPSGLNGRRMSYSSGLSFQSQNNINCFQMPVASANERPCYLPNFRTSIGANRYPQNNYLTGYTSSSSFQGCKVAVNNANSSFVSCIPRNHPLTYNAISNSVSCIPSNHPLTNANRSSLSCIASNQPLTHNLEAFRNHSSVGIADVKTQSLNNTFDSVGGADIKTESQSTNNPLDSIACHSQLITQMPETEKFYTDPETLDSNDDCFYNQMLSLKEGFFDNSRVSLDDIYFI
ncbi:unnamed protein product [Lathyrus oleraceus]